MPTADFSRHLFQPEKRYVGAFLQQGRVLTDEDLNAHRRLAAEDERLTFRDIICARGTPNGGFRITGLTSEAVGGVTAIQFDAATGCYYLGGLRFAVLETTPESFLHQSDWLQIDVDPTLLPTPPTAVDLTDPASGNPIESYDLVYLRAWEQNVTATEDSELLERALGGPDTSVYRRRMRRLELLRDVPGDCADAFAQLVTTLTAPAAGDVSGIPHAFEAANSELRSKARLTVGFSGTGPSDDLCKPRVAQGYLGAENQAIRVQLTTNSRFVWGYDNASPLYRVQITTEGGLNQVKFLTQPRDAFAQPQAGQVVEILPWGAFLPNQEKVAELSGHLTLVDSGYNPDTQTIVIHQPIPTAWIDWLDATEHAGFLSTRDATKDQKYFYLRVWSGVATDPTEPDSAFTPGTAVDLGDTGLAVTFSDHGLPVDYWIIAARPNTPDRVVPWNLLEQAAPFGPRWYFGSLALIRWRLISGEVVGDLIDCRIRFRPLCQLKGCCTIIVGDGHTSHGEFVTIQDAIEALPPEGGEVCVLRGEYRENITITGRTNITIRGCGPDTRVIGVTLDPVFEIIDSTRIEITHLAIIADGMIGVHAHTATTDQIQFLALTRLFIHSRDRAAIAVENARTVLIRDCRVQVQSRSTPLGAGGPVTLEPAVFVQGDVLRIEHNRIIADEADAARRGTGGLHIGGDSQDVEIRRNVFRRGNNHGITLGSIVTRVIEGEPGNPPGFGRGPGFTIVVDDEGCIQIVVTPPGGGPDGEPTEEVDAGPPLVDVRIIDNLIEEMGGCGISVVRFFDLETSPDFITVNGLLIADNRIRGCMLLEVGELPAGLRDVIGFGGIALADVDALVVRDNMITNNGAASVDPISGLFALHVEGALLDRNVIVDNGRVDSADAPLRPGRRGGIVLAFARAPVGPPIAPLADLGLDEFTGVRQTGVPAAHVHDNIVVSPAGRALEILALGPVSVEGNELTAKGRIFRNQLSILGGTTTNTTSKYGSASLVAAVGFATLASASNPLLAIMDLLGGSTVAIFNLGFSNEIYLQLLGLSGLFLIDDLPTPEAATNTEVPRQFVGGNILFNDNQVVFDAFAPGISFTLSSVLLISLDDISMQGNQCDCDLTVDLALLNILVLGFSVRVADNRLKEGILPRHLSGLTLAVMNHTTDNQSTYCLHAIGKPAVLNDTGNTALVELMTKTRCATFGDRLKGHYQAQLGAIAQG